MAKRDFDTDIWDVPAFTAAHPNVKLLSIYMMSKCDRIGIFIANLPIMRASLGFDVTHEHIQSIPARVMRVNEDRYWLVDFIHSQYRALSSTNKFHRKMAEELAANGLWGYVLVTPDSDFSWIEQTIGILPDTLSNSLPDTLSNSLPDTLSTDSYKSLLDRDKDMDSSSSSSLNQNPNTEQFTREERNGGTDEQQQRTNGQAYGPTGGQSPRSRGELPAGYGHSQGGEDGAALPGANAEGGRARGTMPIPAGEAGATGAPGERQAPCTRPAGLQAAEDHPSQGREIPLDARLAPDRLPAPLPGPGRSIPVGGSGFQEGASGREGAERPLLALEAVDPSKYPRETEIGPARPKSAGMKGVLLSCVPDAVQVWKAMPPKSRERSSTEQWLKAWNEARKKGLPPVSEMLAAVEAWKRSGKWAEDGGRWQEGAHRWLAGRQWENIPMSPMQADEEMIANVMERFL